MTNILIVDDEPQVRQVLCAELEAAGYEVREAPNGKEGMKALRDTPSDLVITDLIMPEMDGLDFIRELYFQHPGLKIIAMTGGGILHSQDYLFMARRLGAHRVISKPFQVSDLLSIVQELVGPGKTISAFPYQTDAKVAARLGDVFL